VVDKEQGSSNMGLITQPIVCDSIEAVVQSVTELCIARVIRSLLMRQWQVLLKM